MKLCRRWLRFLFHHVETRNGGKKVDAERCRVFGLRNYRIRMIKEGCDLGIDKHPQLIAGLTNYKSIYESEEVTNMLLNELKRMKQAGLIECVENDPIGCAPLGAVPKADGKVRIIVDCTANGLNQRLNDCIRDMPMQLPTIRQAIKQ